MERLYAEVGNGISLRSPIEITPLLGIWPHQTMQSNEGHKVGTRKRGNLVLLPYLP